MASTIWGLIKAIPTLLRVFEQCMDLYYQSIKVADENRTADIAKERDELLANLKREDITDDQRRVIRHKLYSLRPR